MPENDTSTSSGAEPQSDRPVVILGGGPCGLYAALTLARSGRRCLLLEKESVVGGLARGHRRGDNFYDLGVHMLHAFDKEVFETVSSVMGDERIEVPLNAKIKWAGSFYRYPLQFGDMVRGMNPLLLARCCAGLLASQAYHKLRPSEPKNAEEALKQLYGKPLYRFFFKEFTTRYWGFEPTQLSATFITTKMPRLSAVDVLRKMFAKIGIGNNKVHAVESALSEETLHYSRRGAETMPRRLAEETVALGCDVVTDVSVDRVELDAGGGRVAAVHYHVGDDPKTRRVDCAEVISTIPLRSLVDTIGERIPAAVRESAGLLRNKAIAVYGLLVNKTRAIDALYIYYRDKTFHRVGEPKNAGLLVNPPDHTVLIVETTCEVGDAKWNGEDSAREAIFEDLEAEGICQREDIVEINLLKTPNGYPVFSLGFEPHLEAVNTFINRIENLQTTGRQGGFCYPNMHKAMRMGADAAGRVLAKTVKND